MWRCRHPKCDEVARARTYRHERPRAVVRRKKRCESEIQRNDGGLRLWQGSETWRRHLCDSDVRHGRHGQGGIAGGGKDDAPLCNERKEAPRRHKGTAAAADCGERVQHSAGTGYCATVVEVMMVVVVVVVEVVEAEERMAVGLILQTLFPLLRRRGTTRPRTLRHVRRRAVVYTR